MITFTDTKDTTTYSTSSMNLTETKTTFLIVNCSTIRDAKAMQNKYTKNGNPTTRQGKTVLVQLVDDCNYSSNPVK